MASSVNVAVGLHRYAIEIDSEDVCLKQLGKSISGREVALLTDEGVFSQPWSETWRNHLRPLAAKWIECRIPSGESSKSLESFSKICSQMAGAAMSRRSVVLAVGGGVVGDLAGFVAASYLRGVDFIQVPTTLLAMVDSSVGGKTGVNLPEGKNLVGAFYQPQAVWMVPSILNTLPPREFSAGMAEVIKYAMIRDPQIFDLVEQGDLAIGSQDVEKVLVRCVSIKRDVVMADERETTGERAVLNFGHTLGHAIEQSAGYGVFLHGEAVALGMVAAARISEEVVGLDHRVTRRLEAVLKQWNLPVHYPGAQFDPLWAALARDKKSDGKRVKWVLCPEAGRTEQTVNVSESVVRSAVAYLAGSGA
ncbi:MAG: 3-dehydroquinate synthase [Candidatus Methylacidiphilales bacterium]